MPRIITNEAMKDNMYRNIFEPLVAAYNTTQNVQPNPHEVFLAAMYLEARTSYWGINIPSASDARRGDPECCLKSSIPMCCKNSVMAGARADGHGAASPETARTETLRKQLDDLVMNEPNGWQQWQAGLDYFYNNVSLSLMYFTYDYKNGRFRDFYNHTLGLFDHPDSYTSGIQFGNVAEGSDGPDKAVTTIDVGTLITGLDLPFPAPYIATYRNTTTLDVFWINENNYVQPTVDGGAGVTSNYHPVNGISNNQTDNALILEVVINDLGVGYTITNLGTQLVVDAPVTGSLPATLFNFDSYALAAWNVSFVDGDDDPTATARIDCWMVWCAPAEVLGDRWAIIYDTTGASWLVYYNLDGGGTPPAGIVADNTVAIPVSTGDDVEAVATITAATIQAQGFITTSIGTGQDGKQTLVSLTYDIAAPVQDFDTGTLSFGVNYAYNDELKGSDGSTLASGITGPEEYAAAWNEFKVSFEETQGKTYPYLNANLPWIGATAAAGGGGSGCSCALGSLPISGYKCWTGNQSGCDVCRDCNVLATNSVFRTSAYSKGDGTYNAPGNIFDATTGRQANLTPIDELV